MLIPSESPIHCKKRPTLRFCRWIFFLSLGVQNVLLYRVTVCVWRACYAEQPGMTLRHGAQQGHAKTSAGYKKHSLSPWKIRLLLLNSIHAFTCISIGNNLIGWPEDSCLSKPPPSWQRSRDRARHVMYLCFMPLHIASEALCPSWYISSFGGLLMSPTW